MFVVSVMLSSIICEFCLRSLYSVVWDYQRAEFRVEVDEEGEYYEYDPVGEDGRRIYMNGRLKN